jgi:hypothetical protein
VSIIHLDTVFAQTIFTKPVQDDSFQNVNSSYSSQIIDLSFSLKGGYRVDQLDWSIAGYLGDDYFNILSELIWKDIEIFQVQFDNEILIKDTFYLRGDLKKGWIYNGANQDTDYNGNDRTNPWSQSENATDDGNIFDFSISTGYLFKFFNSRFHLIPLVGYSHNNQYLTITNGYQTISEPILDKQIFPAPLGSFPGLDSSYKTEWTGPWIGLDMAYVWKNLNQLAISIEYHRADYYAKANWNLIKRFKHPKSFEHIADGNGIIINTNWSTQFCNGWHSYFDLTYQDWQTGSGVDRTFFSDGTSAETRLNEVNWKSYAIMCGIAYRF